MDFFEAQDNAHARTKWLIVYFVIAVALIVLAVYAAVTAGYFYYAHWSGEEFPPFYEPTRFFVTLGTVVAVILLGSVFRIVDLRRGGGAYVAQKLGGRRISESTKLPKERQLMNVVEEMSIAAGMPVPAVYVLDAEPGINAFAAGFGMNDAAVAVTRGALESFSRDELQGVIAHEFSHILNGDMRLNTTLSGWIFGIVMLTILGRGFWMLIRGGDDGGGASAASDTGGGWVIGGSGGGSRGGGGGDRGKGGGAGGIIIAVILVAVLITIIGFIGEFFARLIQAAVSRQREYLADASAVQFTRNPEGIGNALRRIGGFGRGSRILGRQASGMAHFFFSKALKSEVSFLATHPPLKRRIREVLPSWDGSFLKTEVRERKVELPQKDKPKPEPPDALGGLKLEPMVTAGIFLRRIGQMNEAGRKYARETREQLKELVPEAFDDAANAPLVMLALLIDREPAERAKQKAVLDEATEDGTDAVFEFADRMRDLARGSRLVLLDLLGPKLAEAISEPERTAYVDLFERLAQADDCITPFELAVLQIARNRLMHNGGSGEVSRQPAEKITGAASVVCTRLARETDSEVDTTTIFHEATRQAPYFMNLLQPASNVSASDMEAAFDVLGRTPFGIRKQLLMVCERIIAFDGEATGEEAELLRAISAAVGVPASPIVGEGESSQEKPVPTS